MWQEWMKKYQEIINKNTNEKKYVEYCPMCR